MHDVLYLMICQASYIASFGYILTNQAIGILIQSPLPGTVRISEVHLDLKCLCNRFVACKLFAVINSQCIVGPGQQFHQADDCLFHCLSGIASHLANQRQLAFAVNQCHQRSLMIFVDNGVAFPVTNANFSLYDFRFLFDSYTIWDSSTHIPAVSTFASLPGFADPQMSVQHAVLGFILPDMLVNTLMADCWAMPSGAELHVFGDLFGRMLLPQLTFNVVNRLRQHLNRFTGSKPWM